MTAPPQALTDESRSPQPPPLPAGLARGETCEGEDQRSSASSPASYAQVDTRLPSAQPKPWPFWRLLVANVAATLTTLAIIATVGYFAWPRDLVLVRKNRAAEKPRIQGPPLLAKLEPVNAPKAIPLVKPDVPKKPVEARDYSRWMLHKTLRWDRGDLKCVAFAPDGKTFAVAGGTSRDAPRRSIETGLVQLWNTETGEAILSIHEPANEIHSIAFYPDGSLLAIEHRDAVKVVNTKDGSVKFTVPEGGNHELAINFHENLIVTEYGRLWDARNGESLERIRTQLVHYLPRAVFSPDGKYCCNGFVIYDGKLSGKYGRLPTTTKINSFSAAAFSHDSKLIGTAFGVWATSDRSIVWQHDLGDTYWPFGATFTPDDKRLLVSDRNKLLVLDAATGQTVVDMRPQKAIGGIAVARRSLSGDHPGPQ